MELSILRSAGRQAIAVGLGVVLVFSACGGDGDEAKAEANGAESEDASGKAVAIRNFLFEPEVLEVPSGTKVTWTNHDDAPHNVQDLSDLNIPLSKDLKKGEKFSIAYPRAGEYKYLCALHDYMKGTIKVV